MRTMHLFIIGLFLSMTCSIFGVPVVTDLNPSFGSDAGKHCNFTGSGFTGTTNVSFGSESAPFYCFSDTMIGAVAPASRPGNVNVTVTASGTSAPAPENNYTYQGDWEVVVSNTTSASVTLIDIPGNTASAPIAIGGGPIFDLAITPDGRTAYITRRGATDVLVFDLVTNTPITTIPTGDAIRAVASPDGSKIYVLNGLNSTISVISTATNTVITTISLPALGVSDIAITPNGATVYVSNIAGSVTPVDTATNTAETPILKCRR